MRPLYLAMYVLLALSILMGGFAQSGWAEIPTQREMEAVCRNWLTYATSQQEGWGGERGVSIASWSDLRAEGMLLARCFRIAPRGFVVVPALKEMPPVKAYSEEYSFDVDGTDGFPALLRDDLLSRFRLYVEAYGTLDARQPAAGSVLFDRAQRERWNRFLADPVSFAAAQTRGDGEGLRTQVGPLLTTAWHQDAPYSNFCPMGDGGRCVVGCVATAVAQVMRYHAWPPRGLGEHQYWWGGDDSCGGQTGGEYLYADFSDDYDWANMPNSCGSCTQAQRDALAELSYEVGVAVDMDYGRCGSGAFTDVILQRLPQHFRYDTAIDDESRNSHTAGSWFGIIQEEINNSRPMVYTFRYDANQGHAIVCDGWRDSGGQNEYHMNYGWGGSFTSWYVVDAIYHTEDPMSERLYRRIMPSQTGSVFTIRPDGSGDYGTIQPAIDAALNGDVIELTDGTFVGDGNRDLDTHGKNLTIRSRSGHPEACVIDCGGGPSTHRAITYHSGEGAGSVLQGLTFTNGYAASGNKGGAVLCSNGSSPTIRSCVFLENVASDALGGDGGGLACVASSPSVVDCRFEGNAASLPQGDGGAVYLSGSSAAFSGCVFIDNAAYRGGGIAIDGASHPVISNCTFHGCSAAADGGGGLWLASGSTVVVTNSILGYSDTGGAVLCDAGPGAATLSCCDVIGNAGGDWTGCLAGQGGLSGNFSSDPLYCDAAAGNLGLTEASPCAPENNPQCGLVGALAVGCGTIHVRADGTGDYPTIQAAIDAAVNGYTVSLADGVYAGPGNRDIDFHGKSVRVASASGNAEACIIDCQGAPGSNHRGFSFISGEGSGAAIAGLTIRNGYQGVYSGGGIECKNGSIPTIEHCRILSCTSAASGGGIYVYQARPAIRHCTVAGNTAGNGAGVYFNTAGTAVTMDHCTVARNTAQYGGAGITCYSALLTSTNNIIAFNTGGAAVDCFYSTVSLTCSNVFGNSGGDYVGCLQGQQGANGNLNRHPCFCDAPAFDFHLALDSPCAPENNVTCGQIGAYGIGCGVSDVTEPGDMLSRAIVRSAAPNPFRENTEITVSLPAGGPTDVLVYDAGGRCVRRLALPRGERAGTRRIVWDGRDTSGRRMPAGAYFCRVDGADEGTVLILTR